MEEQIMQAEKAEETKKCLLCGRDFAPNKYRPIQSICSDPVCQLKRQYSNVEDWRRRNPTYFRLKAHDFKWVMLCRKRSTDWRKRHPSYPKRYRRRHRRDIRIYMREYMRRYRAAKKRK